jgi:hypothetical protein
VGPNDKLTPAILRLLDVSQGSLAELDRLNGVLNDRNAVIDGLRQFERQTEDKLVSLKQWEIWGHRLLRMKRGIDAEVGSDQLRLSLEEDFLSSTLTKDDCYEKMSILKMEKAIFMRFQSGLLSKSASRQPSWSSLIIFCRFLSSQYFAGGRGEPLSLPFLLASPKRSETFQSDISPILRPKIILPELL